MDLLYSRYASPMEFMNVYIEQECFGEFVTKILEMETERKEQEAQKETDNKLWIAYIHSMSKETFSEWKKGLEEQKNVDYSMTKEQIEKTKEQAKGILAKISPV